MVRGLPNSNLPAASTDLLSCVGAGSAPSRWLLRYVVGQARCAWVGLPNTGCAQRHDRCKRLRREDSPRSIHAGHARLIAAVAAEASSVRTFSLFSPAPPVLFLPSSLFYGASCAEVSLPPNTGSAAARRHLHLQANLKFELTHAFFALMSRLASNRSLVPQPEPDQSPGSNSASGKRSEGFRRAIVTAGRDICGVRTG